MNVDFWSTKIIIWCMRFYIENINKIFFPNLEMDALPLCFVYLKMTLLA